MKEKVYEHIRIDFDGAAKLIIRREEADDEKAVLYTDLPILKEELRTLARIEPDFVTVLVDDPDDPEADTGMMQAIVYKRDTRETVLLGIQPVGGIADIDLAEGDEFPFDNRIRKLR